jgi:hypothetical protein
LKKLGYILFGEGIENSFITYLFIYNILGIVLGSGEIMMRKIDIVLAYGYHILIEDLLVK